MEFIQLRQPRGIPVMLVLAGALVGALLGWFGPSLASGLAALIERTPFPVHGLVRLLAGLDHAWSLPVLTGLGLLGGVVLAVGAVAEAPTLFVARDHIEHRQETREVWVERADVATAFRDGSSLVLLRTDGALQARLDVDDLGSESLRRTLDTLDWPVRDEDPFDADFQPWADGRPGFTPEENAALRRRRDARGDTSLSRAADEDLAAVGLVVRTRDKRLQVRRVRRG